MFARDGYVWRKVCVVLRKHVFDENSFMQVCFLCTCALVHGRI